MRKNLIKFKLSLNNEQTESKLPVKVNNDLFIEAKDHSWNQAIGKKVQKRLLKTSNQINFTK